MAMPGGASRTELQKYRKRAEHRVPLYEKPKTGPANPWMTNVEPGIGRSAFVDFAEGQYEEWPASGAQSRKEHEPTLLRYEGVGQLRYCLEQPTRATGPSRSIVIVEDLDKETITFLGTCLRIPPEFFIAHFGQPLDLPLVDERGGPHNSKRYWKVGVPRLHKTAMTSGKTMSRTFAAISQSLRTKTRTMIGSPAECTLTILFRSGPQEPIAEGGVVGR